MSPLKRTTLGVENFFDDGPAEPSEEEYPEEEEFETYQAAGLAPDHFLRQEPEFAKRYSEWLAAHPKPEPTE